VTPDYASLDPLVQTLKKLAEPTRLRLVTLLGHGELTVGEICRVVGQSQPRVSRHLRLLAEAGILDRVREQRCIYYRRPVVGSRAGWLDPLLASLDLEDAALQRDQVRLAAVVRDREERAARELGLGPPVDENGKQRALASALREELGAVPLGELLDIGTGTGRILKILAAQASRAIGVDRSAPALRLARARLHGCDLAHCEFQRGDMYALPFAAESFDTVTIDGVLTGAERPAAVLGEASRVLRRAGRLLLIEKFADIAACTRADPQLLVRQWFDATGFTLVRLRQCEIASVLHLLALGERR